MTAPDDLGNEGLQVVTDNYSELPQMADWYEEPMLPIPHTEECGYPNACWCWKPQPDLRQYRKEGVSFPVLASPNALIELGYN